MSWEWFAGHVQDKSQDEVLRAIQACTETLSNRRVLKSSPEFQSKVALSQYPLVTIVSPMIDGWVTFWGYSKRWGTWVFQSQGLTGLILSGYADSADSAEDYAGSSWEHSLWEKGHIIDWFVSNPSFEFSAWGLDPLQSHITPYLQSRGLSPNLNGLSSALQRDAILRVVDDNRQLFSGNPDLLADFVLSAIDNVQVEKWHSMQMLSALECAPSLLAIPLVGPDYNIWDIAAYIDMKRGLLPGPRDLHYLDLKAEDRYERPADWIEVSEKAEPITFTPTEGTSEYDVHLDLGFILYYE